MKYNFDDLDARYVFNVGEITAIYQIGMDEYDNGDIVPCLICVETDPDDQDFVERHSQEFKIFKTFFLHERNRLVFEHECNLYDEAI